MSGAGTLRAGGLVLRRARAEDAAAFDALQHAAYAPNRALLGMEPVPLLTPPETVLARYETWLAEDAAGLAGALALEPRESDLTIWSVSVHPRKQDSGLGRALLDAAEIRAGELGYGVMRLFTGAPLKKNIDWYGRRGYETERIEEMPDGRRLVHMIKRL